MSVNEGVPSPLALHGLPLASKNVKKSSLSHGDIMGLGEKMLEEAYRNEDWEVMARVLVVMNFNTHRDPSRSPLLTTSDVYTVYFSRVMSSWKAVIASSVIRGFFWDVSFNGLRKEAYIDVYKKINNVKIQMGDKK